VRKARPLLVIVVAVVCAVVLASCSSSRTHAASASPSDNPSVVDGITIPPVYVTPPGTVVPGPTTCPASFAAALAGAAGGAPYAVTTKLTSHLLTCTYQAAAVPPVPAGSCAQALILVNTEPQAFKAFDRWNVETGQNSMWTGNPALQPTPIMGIGIEAEWVPALLELGTGNDTTWVSVTLTCAGGNTPPVLELAKQLAIAGLASTA
jgi:hypothetical protein